MPPVSFFSQNRALVDIETHLKFLFDGLLNIYTEFFGVHGFRIVLIFMVAITTSFLWKDDEVFITDYSEMLKSC